MPLDVENLIPEAAGGSTTRDNLWLACSRCNDFKGDRMEAVDPETGKHAAWYDPRRQRWSDHFEWSADGAHIRGKTAIGRATVEGLRLNNDFITMAR